MIQLQEIQHYGINNTGLFSYGSAWFNIEDIVSIQKYQMPEALKIIDNYFSIGLKNGTVFLCNEVDKDKILSITNIKLNTTNTYTG